MSKLGSIVDFIAYFVQFISIQINDSMFYTRTEWIKQSKSRADLRVMNIH